MDLPTDVPFQLTSGVGSEVFRVFDQARAKFLLITAAKRFDEPIRMLFGDGSHFGIG